MAKITNSKRWRDNWRALSRPNKVTFVLSVIAITLTIVSLITDIIQNKQQNDLSREMFFFQIESEANSKDQTQMQIDIQNTQTALNAQLEAIARLQAFPLMELVSVEKPVFVITQIVEESGTLSVFGNITTILANNGGARAGLISIEWMNNTSSSVNLPELSVVEINISGHTIDLPASIEAQTPVKIQINTLAKLKPPKIETTQYSGNRDYQLKNHISDIFTSSESKIEFRFSNTNMMTLSVSDVSFQISGFNPQGPTPPSGYFISPTDLLKNYLYSLFASGFGYFIGFIILLILFVVLKNRKQKK